MNERERFEAWARSDEAARIWTKTPSSKLFETFSWAVWQASASEDRLDAERLRWLHENNYVDSEGYEYGVARVRFRDKSVLWCLSDHSDVDYAAGQDGMKRCLETCGDSKCARAGRCTGAAYHAAIDAQLAKVKQEDV